MRTLHQKKYESIDILTAAHRLIHEVMGMKSTMGSRFLLETVIHLMYILLKEAAWVLQFILVVLDGKRNLKSQLENSQDSFAL